jgi:hypothetical protein
MSSRITALRPSLALPGGRITIEGGPFAVAHEALPVVRLGGVSTRVQWAARTRIGLIVPPVDGGDVPVRIEEIPGETAFLHVGTLIATGIHQVDSPAVDHEGVVYLTYSGGRGQQAPVSIYRVAPGGPREVFVTGLTNPTSLAFAPDGSLYVSSRFDGAVYRVDAAGRTETVATELGVACGLAFAPDGTLYVGDRTGTIFRIPAGAEPEPFAALPPSVAAFHLAAAPGGGLYVTGPTLSARDAVYRVSASGAVSVLTRTFGRPQGLAVDGAGRLHVVDALAGASGVYRLDASGQAELVVAGADLIGVAFEPAGGAVVATSDAAYRFPSSAFA